MEEHPRGKCLYCDKSLKAFTATNDWKHRHLHKCCWVKIMDEIHFYERCLVECDSEDILLKSKERIKLIRKKWML